MIRFEPSAGSHIQHACEKAVALASTGNDSVSFSFNGVDVIVSPGEIAEAVVDRWSVQFDRNAEAYRNSPEGKAAAADQEVRRSYCQRSTDDLIAKLPDVVGDLPGLVRWLVALSNVADRIDVDWNKSSVADAIEEAGWKRNAHVGRPKEDFDDATIMGEYLVGQSLDCLRKGVAPHPVLNKFAKDGGFLS